MRQVLVRLSAMILSWTIFSLLFFQSSLLKDDNTHETRANEDQANYNSGVTNPFAPFPVYGTHEFAQTCPWAIPLSAYNKNCSLFVRPSPTSGEGIAQWLSQVASGFFLSLQVKCHLYLDYGPDVDVSAILIPSSGGVDWRPDADTLTVEQCESLDNCHVVQELQAGIFQAMRALQKQQTGQQPQVVGVPYYRHYYDPKFRKSRELPKALPGFQIQSGFACAMGALFQLINPLPRARMDKELVISLYIRTGNADAMVRHPDRREKVLTSKLLEEYLDCAKKVERQLLLDGMPYKVYEGIVWQVVSDAPSVKRNIQEKFNNTFVEISEPAEQRLRRQVRISESLGKHTRAKIKPSTQDFAEAVRDWFWLGESHVVLEATSGVSFGQLASLRTARTIYNLHTCTRRVPNFSQEANQTPD